MRRFCLLLAGILVSAPICVLLMHQAKGQEERGNPQFSGTQNCFQEQTVPKIEETVSEMSGRIITAPIPGTPLVVLQYSAYEGPYVEDGSDREVGEVASILLYNSGDQMIGCCQIFMQLDSDVQQYTASMLPPGKTALVMEACGKPYQDEIPYGFRALIRNEDSSRSVMERLRIENAGMGSVRVTNRSGKELTGVQLHYKTTVPGGGVYIGGITYSADVGTLKPGEDRLINLTHFAYGYSTILWADEE